MATPQLWYSLSPTGEPEPVLPEDLPAFQDWLAGNDQTAAFDRLGLFEVRTVFVGIDLGGWIEGLAPRLWTTWVIHPTVGQRGAGAYSSLQDALAGHKAVVDGLRGADENDQA
jgi:hypothetical protein